MEQIKYKAWDLKHKCWFKNTSDNPNIKFGSKDDYLEDLFISMTGIPYLHIAESAHNMTIEQSRERPDFLTACPSQFEIVLYTGKKDKNKEEIYKDYIVKGEYDRTKVEGTVIWWRTGWYVGYINGKSRNLTSLDSLDNIEILGNIYENKDLIK